MSNMGNLLVVLS